MGVPILGRIEAPGTVEGGDCVWVDAKTLAIGRGVRTNEAGIRQMAALLAPKGIEVLGYDLPLWHGEEACLHLMSVISPLADDLALVYSPLLPAAFYQLLKARGIRLVEGDAQEFHDSFGLSLNVLPTGAARSDRGRRLPEDRRGDGSRRLPGADLRGGRALHRLRRRADLPDAPGVAGMTTLGEALIDLLEAHGVDTVFGIPGVHTVELYRGLAGSKIRHVTPRHEQGAGFMADGYARASGKPGVAFVITGPGLTNTLTAMGQARAEFRADAGDLRRQRDRHARQGFWPSARTARPARHDGEGGAVVAPHRQGRRTARRAGRRLRAVRQRAAGTGPYRDPDRRDDHAGGRLFRRSSPMPAARARRRADREGRRACRAKPRAR